MSLQGSTTRSTRISFCYLVPWVTKLHRELHLLQRAPFHRRAVQSTVFLITLKKVPGWKKQFTQHTHWQRKRQKSLRDSSVLIFLACPHVTIFLAFNTLLRGLASSSASESEPRFASLHSHCCTPACSPAPLAHHKTIQSAIPLPQTSNF